jgi:hypothetical protein
MATWAHTHDPNPAQLCPIPNPFRTLFMGVQIVPAHRIVTLHLGLSFLHPALRITHSSKGVFNSLSNTCSITPSLLYTPGMSAA